MTTVSLIGLGTDFYEEDFVIENIYLTAHFNVFNFTISAGAIRSFNLTIIDDSIAEYSIELIHVHLGVYERNGGRDYHDDYFILLEDNDGKFTIHTPLLAT